MISSDQIETALVRAEAHGPDEPHKFAVDYEYEGCTYSLSLWAADWQDAERRVGALRRARLVGQVYAERNVR